LARILIGWELGAGEGHSTRQLKLAQLLAKRGHEPLFAPQQIGPFAAQGPTWQAPVWPRLLGPLSRRYAVAPATMGDMLAYLGLDDRQVMAAMIMAWDRVVADARPDVVVAEYAPLLQLAVRGRLPCVAWGTGFSLPPADMREFPSLFGEAPAVAEPTLLAGLNGALASTGRKPLGSLPKIFAADRSLAATFTELDPYRQWRSEPVSAPAVTGSTAPAAHDGKELFVYLNTPARRPEALIQALVQARLPMRIYDPLIDDRAAAALGNSGIAVEREPVPFSQVAAGSRLVVSHGGLGFASSSLIAGLPQVIIPFDQEKRLTAEALARLGLCRQVDVQGLDAGALVAVLRSAWDDDEFHARSREAAPGFRERMAPSAEETAADLVEELV
jgi:UDP:flavonoid glycosyltransferase YjiC (YdhE family)